MMGLGAIVLHIFESWNIPVVLALVLGLLTAARPCDLVSNAAILAYISSGITNRKYVATVGILYTLGRVCSYSLIGSLIILAGFKISWLFLLLRESGEQFMAIAFLIVGLLLLSATRLPFVQVSEKLSSIGRRVASWGPVGGFILGVLFAAAFCPYSGIIFFGALIPLAVNSTGGLALPAVFGVGTGLPILIFSILLSFGVTSIPSWSNAVTRAKKAIRLILASVFLGAGIYYMVLWLWI